MRREWEGKQLPPRPFPVQPAPLYAHTLVFGAGGGGGGGGGGGEINRTTKGPTEETEDRETERGGLSLQDPGLESDFTISDQRTELFSFVSAGKRSISRDGGDRQGSVNRAFG